MEEINVFEDPRNYAKMGSIYWSAPSSSLSPFDFKSIMKSGYESSVVLRPGYSWSSPSYSGATTVKLSVHDINSIYRVYAKALTAHEVNDGFGMAVATGDYDDDGYEDIAVGFRDYLSSGADAGSWKQYVYFFRGVATDDSEAAPSTRYVPWFIYAVGVAPDSTDTMALASGDFNGDGITDLAVGQPWYNGNRGQVKVLFVNTLPTDAAKSDTEDNYAPWGRKGVQHEMTLLPSDVGLNTLGRHRFGAALAAGQLTVRRGTTSTPVHDLLIGAPGATNNLLIAPRNGGAVAHVRGTDTVSPASSWSASLISLTWSPSNATGVDFGTALGVMPYFCASSTSSNSYTDTFVVGAPGYNANAGAVYVYGCTVDSAGSTFAPSLLRTVTHSQSGARYGQALQAFRTLTASGAFTYTDHYVAIGAPGYTGSDGLDSGIVYLDHFEL
ncbi:MAG TPA: FG-GAP repeat protein, partial [Myxococcaceae bacterium]|nr:FG-GAP repeat protein [Myxococcaceae bacterium]